eukprot:Amastigsp_a676506_166.p2 type:complete len:286 gc:universal Amastigsp_a676506_166:884-27(-)
MGLDERKRGRRKEMLARLHRLEADKRNRHRHQDAEHVKGRVRDVEAVREPARGKHDEGVQRNQIDDEHVRAPRRDHVEVGNRRNARPEERAVLDGLDPHEVGDEHRKDGDAFVIVRPGDRARDKARNNREQSRGREPGRLVLELAAHVVGDQRSERREDRRGENTHVADGDRKVEEVQDLERRRGGHHEAGVDRPADDTAERIPRSRIEPVVEVVEPVLDKVLRRAVVEVGIELVDDALVAQNGKETCGHGKDADHAEDSKAKEHLVVSFLREPHHVECRHENGK